MSIRRVATTLALLLPSMAQAASFQPPDVPRNTAPAAILGQVATGPRETRLTVGDRAPAFSYLGPDGHWHDFAHLAERGPLLLLFGATESDLRAIERAQPVFADLGLTPVAVVDLRSGSACALARRLRLSTPLITDPIRAIAGLYNSLDPSSLGHAPAFFVLDESRTIRALAHGPLPAPLQLIAVSARSLGRLLPGSAFSHFSG